MLAANILVFGRLLRSLGLPVSPDQLGDVLKALGRVRLERRGDVGAVFRALLVRRREDLPVFDAAFAAFWQDHGGRWGRRDLRAVGEPGSNVTLQVEAVTPIAEGTSDLAKAPESLKTDLPRGEVQTWSPADTLRDRDLAELTEEELAQARAALDALTWSPGERRTRRWVSGEGPRIDLRRAWRHSLTSGELFELPTQARRSRPRPIVLFADVSGSMERYSRMLLHFAHVLTRANRRVEAFVFSSRLTRITAELRRASVDAALTAAARRVPDWSGGTRIGEALRTFHVRWARRLLGRGPVVLVVSDGWDRGEPAMLRQEVARLQRSCHRLIWLTPLLGTADYRPLTRGLVAALPFVDDFLPARTLRHLEDLAQHLNALPPRRPPRRQAPR